MFLLLYQYAAKGLVNKYGGGGGGGMEQMGGGSLDLEPSQSGGSLTFELAKKGWSSYL